MTTQTDPVYFLLVDDLTENLVALEALLRREGLVILKARSGPEALEILLKYEVALALVDVQMPGMDGFELAELMRGTQRTRRVPIIFVTAGTADRHQPRFRGYEAGAVDFLHKPIEPDILKSKAEVFFELFRQRQEVARQRDELKAATEANAKLLEESRQFAQALKDADRRKDEFLATLAHELRNPLAPVRTGLQLLRRCPPGGDVAAKAHDMMERQLEHMVRLIDDLLDVSRITSGKIKLRTERVAMKRVVEVAVESSRPQIEAARHTLELDLPPEPLWVEADVTRLAQVFGNLLTNAAKYTPDGGRITLTARPEGDKAVVRVTDTGLGIPHEMLTEVFVMFAQVNRTLDRAQGGLGIGLALVQRLVEMHGGTIGAESPGTGMGSTFTVRLPIAAHPVAEGEPPAPTATRSPAGRLRILVVDDNQDAADSLADLFTLSGHMTRTVYTGRDAVAAAVEFSPDVVVLDIGLPGKSGYEVVVDLRKEFEGPLPALVALTGWGGEEDQKRSQAAGFDYHLTKPVDAKDLDRVFAQIRADRRGSGTGGG